MQSLTAQIADFIAGLRYEHIPEDVLDLGRKSLLDGLGLAVAGSRAESGRIVNAYLADLGFSRGDATVLGTNLRLPARFAAFSNGIAIHADDFDDTQLAAAPDRVYGLLMHPTAPVLPAALAIAERENRSGADFIAAYHAGIEVCCKIAEAAAPRHYQDGFHTTGTCGAFGAAAAAANLLRLDPAATAATLGLAASQSAGLRENFGTMTKPFHPGRSAESAILAADLVRRGFTAAPNILEAPRGFYRAAAGGHDDTAIRDKLGAPWTFATPGISIKPHPSGSLTHPAMSVVLDLVTRHDIHPNQVRQVRVGTNRHMPTTLLHNDPANELQAKFSMPFSVAILVLRRRAGLADYTDATVQSPEIRDLMRRVDFHVHPEAEAAGYHRMTTIVEIELTDGTVHHARADYGKGSPANPMTWSEVAAKFEQTTTHAGLPSDRVRTAIRMVEDLPDLADLARLPLTLAP